jgi:MT0933-like antitoxin protein
MGILDKIKGLLKGNKTAVTQGVDKASGLIAGKVGAEHADKVAAGAEKVKDVINKID